MKASPMSNRLEILSPAGDPEAMRAAVANGADAVYFGISGFNARHRAGNPTADKLAEQVSYLHAHNVRAYVAFNTLIFSDELTAAVKLIEAIAASGADAVIVQDLGLAGLIHRMVPTLPLHASTQMTLSDPRGIAWVKPLGIERVILPRELSIEQIGMITSAVGAIPVEAFVHGALCVSYSGQCLTSESIGGRSANRGQCAQACRLPYELIVDTVAIDNHGRKYLLSPQDLAAYDRVGALKKAGVAGLKIEGRLKSAQYVAATTGAYRAAADAADAGKQFDLPRQQQDQLTQSFSRGFAHGFLDGADHQTLVPGLSPKNRGILVGEVAKVYDESVVVRLRPGQRLKAGDGVVFDQGHPEQDEQGGRIFDLRPAGRDGVEVVFMLGTLSIGSIAEGNLVWKTDDPAIRKELTQTYSRDQVVQREKLTCIVRAAASEPLKIELTDARGNHSSAQSESALQLAQKHPLTAELLKDQIGRLGATPFELGELRLVGRTDGDPADPVMVPKSVLNDLRRQAVEALLAMRGQRERHLIADAQALSSVREDIEDRHAPADPVAADQAQVAVLVRTMDQLTAVLNWHDDLNARPPAMVYCEFEDARRYGEAVTAARGANMPIGLATLRIAKPGEDGFLKLIADAAPDAVLVRTLSALTYFKAQAPQLKLIGDYTLNVANELTADLLVEGGVSRLTAGYDLNWQQLSAMLCNIDAGLFEAVVHQHMPMFHMEHCVFAAMLSEGRDYRTCGRPCEKHVVALRDRMGVDHPLVADAGCRNTVYNGRAQSAADYMRRLLKLGIGWYRVELLKETAEETTTLLNQYARTLAGKQDPEALRSRLRVLNHLGVTPGTIEFE